MVRHVLLLTHTLHFSIRVFPVSLIQQYSIFSCTTSHFNEGGIKI